MRIRRLYSSTIWLALFSLSFGSILFIEDPAFQGVWSFFVNESGDIRWVAAFFTLFAVISFIGFTRAFLRYLSSSASSMREIADERSAAEFAAQAGVGVLSQDELEEIEQRNERFERERLEAETRRRTLRRLDDLTSFDGFPVNSWQEVLISGRRRLAQNADRLAARSRVNLLAGIGFSIVAIGTLLLIVLFPGAEDDSQQAIGNVIKILPRYTLVILLQTLSFFFLRNFLKVEAAYRENKNEITNIEMKLAAGMFASADGNSYETLLEAFAKDDRNNRTAPSTSDAQSSLSPTLTELIELLKFVKND